MEAELSDWIDAAATPTPGLREHPLRWRWMEDIVPGRDRRSTTRSSTRCSTGRRRLGTHRAGLGLDSWHDAAHFTRWGKTPTLSFGPDGIDSAHAVDEQVSVDGLVDHCAAVALAAMRWCGV